MIVPPYLMPGDKVALISPSRYMEMSALPDFKKWVEDQGWEFIPSPNLGQKEGQLGGSDEQRLSDIEWALLNPEIKAVFSARGGYGLIRLWDKLKALPFKENPKWWVGFSDFTVLHAVLEQQGCCSIHGPMAMQLNTQEETRLNFSGLANCLRGAAGDFPFEWTTVDVEGNAKIWGGNLSMIYALLAAGYEPDIQGKILFIEELDEYLYHIDRMMSAMDARGLFHKAKAVAVGSFIDMHDNAVPFGKNAKEIIEHFCRKHNKPLIWDLPIGHDSKNQAIKLGFGCTFGNSKLTQTGGDI